LCTWLALFFAAILFSRQFGQTKWVLYSALPAFACEALFYLAATFKETREPLRKLRSPLFLSVLLWVSALAPYFVYSVTAQIFAPRAFALLAGLTAVLSFWHAVLPRRAAYDFGFLVVAAAPQLTHAFARIYPSRDRHLPIDLLGHLAWIHAGIVALLVLRDWNAGEFSLWPSVRDWQIGLVVFVASIAPLIWLALGIHDVHYEIPQDWPLAVARSLGTFFGVLWVVALSEELFFRGFIQRALAQVWRSVLPAILITATLFGAAHLGVNHFPNWHRAIVAAALGLACGIAYWRAGSVRASMVTHASVVATWRLFFH
jgi:membrane protease YdiL (CAAX protease family)